MISSDAFFTAPDFWVSTRALENLPVLFWLTDLLRPQHVVARGTETLTAYLGVCQIAKARGLLPQATLTAELGSFGDWIVSRHDRLYGSFSTLQNVQDPAFFQHLDAVDLLLIAPDELGLCAATLARRTTPMRNMCVVICGTVDSTSDLQSLAAGWISLPEVELQIAFLGTLPDAARDIQEVLHPGEVPYVTLLSVLKGLIQRVQGPQAEENQDRTETALLSLYQKENFLLTKALQSAFAEREALRKVWAESADGRALQQHLDSLTRAHDAQVAELTTRITVLTQQLDHARHEKLQTSAPQGQSLRRPNPFLAASAPKADIFSARKDLQIGLARWQAEWLSRQKGLLRRKIGPSGGLFAAELAKVAASPYFDSAWYLTTYPDVAKGRMSPEEHFLRHGLFEARNPGPNFNTLGWYLDHPEALAARHNPLLDHG